MKAGRICPGYRNTIDLMFYDESTSIVKKSRSSTETLPEKSSEDQDGPRQRPAMLKRTTPVLMSNTVFYQPLDDLAINFFMATYVGNDRVNSQFDYLPEFYRRHGSAHIKLQHSIRAVGLAGYAKASRRADLIQPATKRYISAIREVNAALSNPVLAVEDSTLASVLLLAMFEVMVMPRNQGLMNLTKHLNGAVSVAALRIKHRQQTEFGKQLMGTLTQSVIMNCWIQGIPLPDKFISLKKQLERNSNQSVHSDFLEILTLLIKFRRTLEDDAYDSPSALISQANTLDGRLTTFMDNMPEEGQFKNVHADIPAHLAFEGYYHVYPKNFTAHLFNNVRSSRMRLHSLIASQSRMALSTTNDQALKSAFIAQLQKSQDMMRVLAKEICATVPQLAGYLDQLQVSSQHSKFKPTPMTAVSAAFSRELDITFACTPPPNNALTDHTVSKRSSLSSSKPLEPPQAVPALPIPRPASLYHLLYQLHMLSTVTILPDNLQVWIKERIQWVEGNADPEDLQLLRTMVNNAPSGAFPFFVNI